MNIKILFPDDEINECIDTDKNILRDLICDVLKNDKLSTWQIYNEIKNNNNDNKYKYTEINKMCQLLIMKKCNKILCKEIGNPSIYFVNDKNNIVKSNKKKIHSENTDILKTIDCSGTIIDKRKYDNNNDDKKEALDDILNSLYKDFINTKNNDILEEIIKIKKIKNNIIN